MATDLNNEVCVQAHHIVRVYLKVLNKKEQSQRDYFYRLFNVCLMLMAHSKIDKEDIYIITLPKYYLNPSYGVLKLHNCKTPSIK